MPNSYLRGNLITKIEGAIAEAKRASNLNHTYLIGRVREIMIQNLIRPLLSSRFDISTGKITDSNGNHSTETDIIIYSKELIPPLMFTSDFGLIPKESVFAVIEVKSKLTKDEIRKTIENFEVLDTLQMNSGFYSTDSHESEEKKVPGIIKSIFAFDTDLTEKTDIERMKETLVGLNKSTPNFNSFCVVKKGYWTFDHMKDKDWKNVSPTDEYDEVISYLSSLVNGLNQYLSLRGFPRIGSYITNKQPE
jgi:hypothetical protein